MTPTCSATTTFRTRCGFSYQSGQIVVQTNTVLHTEAITPALALLGDPRFGGANEEFLKAHEHYRHGRLGECLVDCLKAFESTMKIVCGLKEWAYKPTDTAKALIEVCLANNLIPTFTQQQLTSLRTLLESGVPTVRNKQAGHGQGATRHRVSPHLARFGLHLTAAVIRSALREVFPPERSQRGDERGRMAGVRRAAGGP